jgi:hypothetical protein
MSTNSGMSISLIVAFGFVIFSLVSILIAIYYQQKALSTMSQRVTSLAVQVMDVRNTQNELSENQHILTKEAISSYDVLSKYGQCSAVHAEAILALDKKCSYLQERVNDLEIDILKLHNTKKGS